jgi:DNA-binding transcriptional regulator/RsmH inhibitor MraZ
MFRGIADVSLDDHGRIAVPTRFRDSLRQHSAGKLVVTIDREERDTLEEILGSCNNTRMVVTPGPGVSKLTR